MKSHLLAPMFAALIFTGAARSENPGQPRPDGSPPGGPMAERLKGRLEELRRDGKREEAGQLERHAREMWQKQRGNPQGEHRDGSPGGTPPGKDGERAGHLAEAAKHLNAAGIRVSPEMLERLGHKFGGRHESRPPLAGGSPGDRSSGGPSRPPFSPREGAGPGAGSPIEAIHKEIQTLAKQVQELRTMVQQQRGGGPGVRPPEQRRDGQPNPGPQSPGVRRPDGGGHRAEQPQAEARREHSPAPGAAGERREEARGHDVGNPGARRPQTEGRESRPANPPVDRPRGDAPAPAPAR